MSNHKQKIVAEIPAKPETVSVSFRFHADLYAKLREKFRKERQKNFRVTFTQIVSDVLEKGLTK